MSSDKESDHGGMSSGNEKARKDRLAATGKQGNSSGFSGIKASRKVRFAEELEKTLESSSQESMGGYEGPRQHHRSDESLTSDPELSYWDRATRESFPTLEQVSPHLPRRITLSKTAIPLVFRLDMESDDPQSFVKKPISKSATSLSVREHRKNPSRLYEQHIISSVSYEELQRKQVIELRKMEGVPEEAFTHWRHNQFMNLDQFEILALQAPHVQKSEDMKVVVKHLMEEVRRLFSKSPRQGRHVLSSVLRYDIHRHGQDNPTEAAATWLCFPYLSTLEGHKDKIRWNETKDSYRTRTLFQWSYQDEPSFEHDEKQMFKKTGKLLFVPQLWVLLLGKETIVSNGPCAFEWLLKPKIELVPIPSENPRLRWVKLIDQHHHEAIVPIEECETYLALRLVVTRNLFPYTTVEEEKLELFVNNKRLTASLWLHFTKVEKSSTITVSIRESRLMGTVGTMDSNSTLSGPESSIESLADSSSQSVISSESDVESNANLDLISVADTGEVSEIRQDQSTKVVCAPDYNLETEAERTVEGVLARSPPFFEWRQAHNDANLKLSDPRLKKEAVSFSILSAMHGEFDSTHSELESSLDCWADVHHEYQNLYRNAHLSTLTRLEGFKNLDEIQRDTQQQSRQLQRDPSTASDARNLRINGYRENTLLQDESLKKMHQISQTLKQLMSLFVSISEGHGLLERLWGTLETFMKSTTLPNPDHRHRLTQMDKWVVLGSAEDVDELRTKYQIPLPDRHPYDRCSFCDEGTIYPSVDEAVQHLSREHYYKNSIATENSAAVSLLVRSIEEAWLVGIRQAHLYLLRIVLIHLENILQEARNVKIELASSVGSEQPDYILPRSVVEAFEEMVLFMLVASHTAVLIDTAYATWIPWSPEETSILKVNDYNEVVEEKGKVAEYCMRQARKDLLDTITEDTSRSTTVHTGVGTRFTVSILLQSLLERPLKDEEQTVDIYRDLFRDLHRRVFHQRPRRRLLGKIHLLQEEIYAILKVRRTQQKVLLKFYKTIDPDDVYHITDPAENAQCHLSVPVLAAAIEFARSDKEELFWIQTHLAELEQKARHRIEVLDEDHGKAIFIFTLVTVVFLPLSFVSSYMGMNTADIRDMGATQNRFWIVAVPVTTVVMGAAMVLAYQGHEVKRWLLKTARHRKQRDRRQRGTGAGEQDSTTQQYWLTALSERARRPRGDEESGSNG